MLLFFEDIIKIEGFDFDNILLDKELHVSILIYGISYKVLIGTKPLHIRLDKVDWLNIVYDATGYLALLGSEKYDFIYNIIRYLIEVKSGSTYAFSHN